MINNTRNAAGKLSMIKISNLNGNLIDRETGEHLPPPQTRSYKSSNLGSPLNVTLVVLRVNSSVKGRIAMQGGVPREESGVVDCYGGHHLKDKLPQRGG